MFKILIRSFLCCFISLQVQAASVEDPVCGGAGAAAGGVSAAPIAAAPPAELLESITHVRTGITNPTLLEILDRIQADISIPSPGSTLTASTLAGYLAVLQEAKTWIASQETAGWSAYPWPTAPEALPSIEEQILAYDVPTGRTLSDVLMDKVTLGVNFASPEIKDPLKRYRLDRLHKQMLELHGSTGITMPNLYEFGLILASLLDNPDVEGAKELNNEYNVSDWFNGYGWLETSLEAQTKGGFSMPAPYCWVDKKPKEAYGVNFAALIFEPSGHFGFHVSNKSYLSADKRLRRYPLTIGFKGSVHGGSINGAVTRYLHDFSHASTEYGSMYQWMHFPFTKFLLSPIFDPRDSFPSAERRIIDFALYNAMTFPGVDFKSILASLTSGTSQKALGIKAVEALAEANTSINSFDLGLDGPFAHNHLHPNLEYDYECKDLKLREERDFVKGEIRFIICPTPGQTFPNLGTCTYDFVLPRSLKGIYAFTLRGTSPRDDLTTEQKALYESIIAELSIADRPQNKVEGSPTDFRIRRGDEVKSLYWLETGKWINPPAWEDKDAYTWDTVLWYQAGMQKVYRALLEKGLGLWSEEPIPEATLALLRATVADPYGSAD